MMTLQSLLLTESASTGCSTFIPVVHHGKDLTSSQQPPGQTRTATGGPSCQLPFPHKTSALWVRTGGSGGEASRFPPIRLMQTPSPKTHTLHTYHLIFS